MGKARSALQPSGDQDLTAGELLAVADVAGQRLLAGVDGDAGDAMQTGEKLREAAGAAMLAGYSLSAIAAAEAAGKEAVRNALRGETLKRVQRTGEQAREAAAGHRLAIARAMRLGLSTREIASAAGVTHGTVRAIAIRQQRDPTSDDADADAEHPSPEGEAADGSHSGSTP